MFKSFCVLLFDLKYAVQRELLQGGKINNNLAAGLMAAGEIAGKIIMLTQAVTAKNARSA